MFHTKGRNARHAFLLSASLFVAFPGHAADEAAVMVSVTRFADSALSKPLSVSVITAEDIRASAATLLPELLAQRAGIHMQDVNGNNGISATVDMRGFGASASQNTLILLDGRRLTDMDQANVNWSSIPLSSIERIEILRGSGAVQFGEGAGGGVINIISRAPGKSDVVTVSGRAGSYNTREAQAFVSRGGDGFGLTLSGSHFESDGYRANNRARQTNAGVKTQFDYGDGSLRLGLDANWMTMRLPGFRQIEWAVGRDDLAANRRGTPTPNDDSARRGQQFAADWRHRLGFGELAVDYTRRTREQWIYSAAREFARSSDMTLDSLSPRLRIPHSLLGGKASLVVGVDWQNWDYKANDAVSLGLMSRPFSKVGASQSNVGIYLQESLDLNERISLLAGVRGERQKLAARNSVDGAATCPFGFCPTAAAPDAAARRESAWELGGRYRLSSAWAVFAKAARAFRFNNVDEIYETDPAFNNQFQFLRPQTNRLKEAGLQWTVARASMKATVFQNDVQDEIHLDAFTNGVGNTNLPPSRRRGLELEGDWQAADTLRVNAAATLTEARFLTGVFPGTFGLLNNVIAGKNVPLVPRQKFNLGGDWEFMAQTHLKASLAYVGKQYMDNDETNNLGAMIPAYTLVNVKLERQMDNWNLALAVNNLTDRKYYAYAVKSQFNATRFNVFPMPERTVFASAEYRFQ
jgi:iron complex outermembrane recepter protein